MAVSGDDGSAAAGDANQAGGAQFGQGAVRGTNGHAIAGGQLFHRREMVSRTKGARGDRSSEVRGNLPVGTGRLWLANIGTTIA
jgi:hypothetical protein